MNKSVDNSSWRTYLETPATKSAPVKLDQILAKRLEAFLHAKNVKSDTGKFRADRSK